MAKSMRSKREKRLRAIRREMVEPIYDLKEAAKLAVQEAALSAPKLPVRHPTTTTTTTMDNTTTTTTMDNTTTTTTTTPNTTSMDVEMADGNQSMGSLKPIGGIGKKLKKKFKMGKNKHRGKGKIRRKHNI